jgi:hypothetical protein
VTSGRGVGQRRANGQPCTCPHHTSHGGSSYWRRTRTHRFASSGIVASYCCQLQRFDPSFPPQRSSSLRPRRGMCAGGGSAYADSESSHGGASECARRTAAASISRGPPCWLRPTDSVSHTSNLLRGRKLRRSSSLWGLWSAGMDNGGEHRPTGAQATAYASPPTEALALNDSVYGGATYWLRKPHRDRYRAVPLR